MAGEEEGAAARAAAWREAEQAAWWGQQAVAPLLGKAWASRAGECRASPEEAIVALWACGALEQALRRWAARAQAQARAQVAGGTSHWLARAWEWRDAAAAWVRWRDAGARDRAVARAVRLRRLHGGVAAWRWRRRARVEAATIEAATVRLWRCSTSARALRAWVRRSVGTGRQAGLMRRAAAAAIQAVFARWRQMRGERSARRRQLHACLHVRYRSELLRACRAWRERREASRKQQDLRRRYALVLALGRWRRFAAARARGPRLARRGHAAWAARKAREALAAWRVVAPTWRFASRAAAAHWSRQASSGLFCRWRRLAAACSRRRSRNARAAGWWRCAVLAAAWARLRLEWNLARQELTLRGRVATRWRARVLARALGAFGHAKVCRGMTRRLLGLSLSRHVRPGAPILCVQTTRTRLLRTVRTLGAGQLVSMRHARYVQGTRTSLGRTVRTAHGGYHPRSLGAACGGRAAREVARRRGARAARRASGQLRPPPRDAARLDGAALGVPWGAHAQAL